MKSSKGDTKSDLGSELLLKAQRGDKKSLGKLLSLAETTPNAVLELAEIFAPTKIAHRIGLTGPPGAGKSTLVNAVLNQWKEKLRIAVLAVDPSSPFTQGAILGDRIRFNEHSLHPNIFVRSIASRGNLGGLNPLIFLYSRLLDLVGFDVVLIETVGVGQTEMDVMFVVDSVVVVLVPESGDGIQMMKAGLLESADYFVVNKADRPGASILTHELQILEPAIPVFATVATSSEGIADFTKSLEKRSSSDEWKKERLTPKRLQEEAKAIWRLSLELELSEKAAKIQTLQQLERSLRSKSN